MREAGRVNYYGNVPTLEEAKKNGVRCIELKIDGSEMYWVPGHVVNRLGRVPTPDEVRRIAWDLQGQMERQDRR
jgi:hypothetical protein